MMSSEVNVDEKIAKAKKIIMILGLITIILGFMIEQMFNAMASMIGQEMVDSMLEYKTVFMVLAIVCGIFYIYGASLLEKDRNKGRLICLIVSIISIKDVGFIVLLILWKMVPKEEK